MSYANTFLADPSICYDLLDALFEVSKEQCSFTVVDFMATDGPHRLSLRCSSSSESIVSKTAETELRMHCLFPQYKNAAFALVTYLHLTKCSSSNVPPFHCSSGVITKINMVLLDSKHSLHFLEKKIDRACQWLKPCAFAVRLRNGHKNQFNHQQFLTQK